MGFNRPRVNPDPKNLSETKLEPFKTKCNGCHYWVKDKKHIDDGKKSRFCPANGDYKICNHCHKKGHLADACKAKDQNSRNDNNSNTNNNSNNDKNSKKDNNNNSKNNQTSNRTMIPYCKYCNNTKHDSASCGDSSSITRYTITVSTLFCTRCRVQGHTRDECGHPACSKCNKTGHDASECKQRELSAYDQFTSRTGSAKQDPNEKLHFYVQNMKLTRSQEMRQEWNDYQKKYGQAVPESLRRATELEIEEAERSMFDKEKLKHNAVDENEMSGVEHYSKSRVDPSYMSGKNQLPHQSPTTRPKTNSNTSLTSLTDEELREQLTLAKASGASEKFLQELEILINQVRRQKLFQRIQLKCHRSSTLYKKENMHSTIVENILKMVVAGEITDKTMWGVKEAFSRRHMFHHDPQAMEALFARAVPRCNVCKCEGIFLDRKFEPIDHNATTETLLSLEDDKGFGILLYFTCKGQMCSDKAAKWTWGRRHVSDDVCTDENDLEHRIWEI